MNRLSATKSNSKILLFGISLDLRDSLLTPGRLPLPLGSECRVVLKQFSATAIPRLGQIPDVGLDGTHCIIGAEAIPGGHSR